MLHDQHFIQYLPLKYTHILGEFGNSWLLNSTIKKQQVTLTPSCIIAFTEYKPVLAPFSLFEKALAVALAILLREFPRETDDNNHIKAHEL